MTEIDTKSSTPRACFVQLTHPLAQVENELHNLSTGDFLTSFCSTERSSRSNAIQQCSVCNQELKHKIKSGPDVDAQVAFNVLRSSLGLPDSISGHNYGDNDIDSFLCCQRCITNLQSLEQIHGELKKSLERFEVELEGIMSLILNAYIQKVINPTDALNQQLCEEQLLLLERWKRKQLERLLKEDLLNLLTTNPDQQNGRIKQTEETDNDLHERKSEQLDFIPEIPVDIYIKEEADSDDGGPIFNEPEPDLFDTDFLIEDEEPSENSEMSEAEFIPPRKKFKSKARAKKDSSKRFLGKKKGKPAAVSFDGSKLPFQCGKCVKSFASQNALSAHSWVHSTPRELYEKDKHITFINSKAIEAKRVGSYLFFVCEVCGKKFSSKYTFKIHVKGAHQGEQDQSLSCPNCKKVCKTGAALNRHISANHKRPLCRFCGLLVWGDGPMFLRRHEYSYHEKEYLQEKPFACLVCYEAFETQANLDAHSAASHESCKICGHKAQNARGAKVHRLRHFASYHLDPDSTNDRDASDSTTHLQVRCLLCNQRFANEDLTKAHYEEHHVGEDRQYRSMTASVKSGPRNQLKGNLMIVAEQAKPIPRRTRPGPSACGKNRPGPQPLFSRRFRCEICGSSFSSAHSLWDHKHVHLEGPNPFICDTCGKSFKRPDGFRQHVKLHTASKSRTLTNPKSRKAPREDCAKCGKSICIGGRATRFHWFHEHREEYLKDHPFLCEICLRAFATQADLDRHRTTTPHHKCNYCDRVFEEKAKLVSHERVHTKEKPFACEICGNRFTMEANCRIHKMIHTGERPFWCTACPDKKIGFFRRKDLEKHTAKMHPKNPIINIHPPGAATQSDNLIYSNL